MTCEAEAEVVLFRTELLADGVEHEERILEALDGHADLGRVDVPGLPEDPQDPDLRAREDRLGLECAPLGIGCRLAGAPSEEDQREGQDA